MQHFVPVLQQVHEQHPHLFGAGAEVVMAAQSLGRPHLENQHDTFKTEENAKTEQEKSTCGEA